MNATVSNHFGKKYEILEELGHGGFATVFLARDTKLGRKVAIKLLDIQVQEKDPTFITRFEKEAQIVGQLNHPNIVGVYEFGQEDGRFFIVMPYLSGPNLSSLISQQGALPVEEVLRMTEQIGAALDYAHKQQIVHRDVKPVNVILNEHGDAILTDFGIVKVMDETTALTQTGVRMGTPPFMAPEQWTTNQVDTRTDLYALGIMVYQMLTGQTPFSGSTPHRIMYSHLHETPPPPHQLNPSLPQAVEKVLSKMLAKSPDQRYQSASHFCTDLRAALTDTMTIADLPVEKEPNPRSMGIWLGAVAVLAILLVGGVILFFNRGTISPPPAPVIQQTAIELDGQAVIGDFQDVVCGKSHRLEVIVSDANNARIEPSHFAYNWQFQPPDSNNQDSLDSGNYARIYQVPCDLSNQTVIIGVQQDSKTLSTESVNFNITK